MEQKLKTTLTQVCLIFLTCLYMLVVPGLLIVFSPLYAFRLLLKFLVEHTKLTGLSSMVSTRSAILAADDMNQSPLASLVVRITCNGVVDLAKFQEDVITKVVMKCNATSGKLVYPQLQQYVIRNLGFFFWKTDTSFNIKHHVRQCCDIVTEFGTRDLDEVHEILIRKPFLRLRSPWEFVLVTLDENPGMLVTQIFFRIHHCLADGFSILQMLMSDLAGRGEMIVPQSSTISNPQSRRKQTLIGKLGNAWKVPHEQVQQRYFSRDYNMWRNEKLVLTRRYHLVTSDFMNVEDVREIKKLHPGTTFTAIILTGLCGAIRQHFITNQIPLLDQLHFVCPLPLLQRPEGLGNYWSFSFIPLPISETSRRVSLQIITDKVRSIGNSTVPTVNYFLIPFVGALPSLIGTAFGRNSFSTGMASIFPGPPQAEILSGLSVTSMVFAGGLLDGDQGILVTMISYAGRFRLLIMVDHAIIQSKEEVKTLVSKMCAETSALGVQENNPPGMLD